MELLHRPKTNVNAAIICQQALTDGSQSVDFVLRDTATGSQTVYHSTFMGPPGYAAPGAK
jgi:hypothetical protein